MNEDIEFLARMCPGDNRKEFVKHLTEFHCLMKSHRHTRAYPSDVLEELRGLKKRLGKLSEEAKTALKWAHDGLPLDKSPVNQFIGLTRIALKELQSGPKKRNAFREAFGWRAREIWITHGGKTDGPEFIKFIDELIIYFEIKRIDPIALVKYLNEPRVPSPKELPRNELAKFF